MDDQATFETGGSMAAHQVARHRLPRLALVGVIVSLLMACTSGAGEHAQGSPTDAAASGNHPAATSGPGAASQQVAFEQVLSDPARFIGQRVEVTGKVFFLSECPPPGSSGPTSCVLQAYLAHQDRGVLVAADAPETLPLAEAGRRVSCDESAQARPACGDWENETRYVVVGLIEQQVLGGRQTSMVWLNVETKTPAP